MGGCVQPQPFVKNNEPQTLRCLRLFCFCALYTGSRGLQPPEKPTSNLLRRGAALAAPKCRKRQLGFFPRGNRSILSLKKLNPQLNFREMARILRLFAPSHCASLLESSANFLANMLRVQNRQKRVCLRAHICSTLRKGGQKSSQEPTLSIDLSRRGKTL